jgi:hypothetical protein
MGAMGRRLAAGLLALALASPVGADTPQRPATSRAAGVRAPLGATLEQARRWRIFASLDLVQDPNVRSLPNDEGIRPLVFVPRRGPFRGKLQVTLTVTTDERVIGAELTFVRALLDVRARQTSLATLSADFLEDVAPDADRATLGAFAAALRGSNDPTTEEHALATARARGHTQRALTEVTFRFEQPSPFMQGFELLDGVRIAVWITSPDINR